MDARDNSRNLALYVGLARPGQLPARRQGMTGAEAWRICQGAVDRFLEDIPPRKRHRYEGKALYRAAQFVRENFGESVWEQYRNARYRAGYHR